MWGNWTSTGVGVISIRIFISYTLGLIRAKMHGMNGRSVYVFHITAEPFFSFVICLHVH